MTDNTIATYLCLTSSKNIVSIKTSTEMSIDDIKLMASKIHKCKIIEVIEEIPEHGKGERIVSQPILNSIGFAKNAKEFLRETAKCI